MDILALSWTVQPPAGMTQSSLNDAGTRLTQYLSALLFYLRLPQVDQIFVFENSGYDFTTLRILIGQVSGKVTFVSTSPDYDPTRGKGYGEFRMYDEGLASVEIEPTARVWKITGRLIVKNLSEIIATAPAFDERPSLYCDLRRVPLVPSSVWGHWMDTRLFAFNVPFYDKHLRGQFGCNYTIEEGFFDIAHPLLKKNGAMIVPRFRCQPIYEGQSGNTMKSYLSGKHLAAHNARKITRRVAPALWL
ncbi:hypothetical protein V6R86_05105 [Sphingomonas kaistensis]|uniref:Glycosyltransferase family 2 protein n=1 Tax=Sphingomonas kaistensis TaxID=298708 RepID=A0ABZ2FZF6_9SPHN